jgi:hypothetical protein
MAQREVSPFRTEKPAHDPASQDNMLLSLRAFHVGFADVAQIVNKEGDPQPGIPREPE